MTRSTFSFVGNGGSDYHRSGIVACGKFYLRVTQWHLRHQHEITHTGEPVRQCKAQGAWPFRASCIWRASMLASISSPPPREPRLFCVGIGWPDQARPSLSVATLQPVQGFLNCLASAVIVSHINTFADSELSDTHAV